MKPTAVWLSHAVVETAPLSPGPETVPVSATTWRGRRTVVAVNGAVHQEQRGHAAGPAGRGGFPGNVTGQRCVRRPQRGARPAGPLREAGRVPGIPRHRWPCRPRASSCRAVNSLTPAW